MLDAVFAALSDSTRRVVLESLSEGSLPVTELANPHDMSLPGFMKHLRVLEDAGLIERSKEGRVVQCTLSARAWAVPAVWSRIEHTFGDYLREIKFRTEIDGLGIHDWRRSEESLNRFPQFRTEIDGLGIHFIHVRSKHPDALPIILTHGWPGSVLEFMEIIER